MLNRTPSPPASLQEFTGKYADGVIEITSSYVRLYGYFYTCSHITSVGTDVVPANRVAWGIIGMLAGGLLGAWLGTIISRTASVQLLSATICGLVLGFILAYLQKDSYVLALRMSSGEAPRLQSPDGEYITHLRNLIVRVIAGRAKDR